MAIPHAAREDQKDGMRLGTVQQVAQTHPGLTEAAVRALVAKAPHNGLTQHIYRIGRRVLIDLDGFERWVRAQQRAA